MKKIYFLFFLFLLSAGIFSLSAAERIAVAEPAGGAGISKEELASFWSMLESSLGNKFELVTRSALKQIITEAGLSENSGLVTPDKAGAAGNISGTDYLLISRISKFGKRYSVTLLVIHASTGKTETSKSVSETADSLDDLANRIPDMLEQAGLGSPAKKYGVMLCLSPVVRTPNAPEYLSNDYSSALESAFLANKVKLRVLRDIREILGKNNIRDLSKADPALYRQIGKILRADSIIESEITRFELNIKKVYVAASRRNVVRCIGTFEGSVRIISAHTGLLVSVTPFRLQEDLSELDPNRTENWSSPDYGKYLIRKTVPLIAKDVLKNLR